MIKVESGIPVPPEREFSLYPVKYPFPTMNVGDSFFVAAQEDMSNLRRRMRQSCAWANERHAPKKFRSATATAPDPQGVRVWRVE